MYPLQVVSLLCWVALAHGNNAIYVNTNTQNNKHVDEAITEWGSDWYYAICSVMGTTAIGIMAASYMKPRSERIFFYMCAAICTTASIAYYAMGSNLGWTPIDNEWVRSIAGVNGRNREIFYVRYIDWFITTPLLLLDLLLTAGLPWPSILWTIFLDLVMIITGLVGFYAVGCVAMIGIFYELAIVARANARRLGADVHRVFMICGVLTLFIWLLYPVSWGLCEGGNVITPNDEAIFYGCLDFIAKPVFSIALIIGHWKINPARLGLSIMSGEERAEQLLEKNDGPDGQTNGVQTNGGQHGNGDI
ncbi:hypothetical protein LTR62_002187 [Meristemomyces frigidus]|uniref:Bacteriorhodopsin n=1 Tax=Meristemomyces frigidus TaxID=1508187 RepID=A0AAN7YFV7_9PEZI|nr:hypothetical protein LTR62_002187 [Meristemomyces frigidus]